MDESKTLSSIEWRHLLLEIHNRQVVPVVGPELITISLVPGEPPQPLHRVLAPKLAAALGLPEQGAPFDSLNRVACQYLFSGGKRKEIYLEVSELLKDLEEKKLPPAPSLCDLASILDFDVFVAGTIDHFLAAALEETRPGFSRTRPNNVLAFDCRRPVDIPETVSPALVYHLLGHRNTYPNFAVWEEDYLEFLYSFTQYQGQLRNLFAMLKNRYLLFLGLPFGDWIVRFFLFVARGGRFSDHRRDEIIAYLADSRQNLGEPLIFFFDQVVGTTKVIPSDPAWFTAELARRWRAAYQRESTDEEIFSQMPDECPRGAVFISYSRDNLREVANLVRGLRAAQVPVWMDKERLQVGVDFERRIEFMVKSHCSFFLSLISDATESNPARYVHEERRWAAERHTDGYVFYLPVIIDDTAQPKLEPAKFAKIHIDRLPGGAVTPSFANRLRALVEEYRVAGQPRA